MVEMSAHDATPPAPHATLADWLLGRDSTLRSAMQFTLMATFICLLWQGLEIDAWRRGIISGTALAALLIFHGTGLIGFNTALRSGWSRRCADLGLTQAQMTFGALSMAAAYATLPHMRAAALQTMCMTLVFGMFRLSPRQVVQIGAVSAAVLLTAVGLLALWPGRSFSVRADLLPALVACVVMLMMTLVLRHFSQLRVALSEQRQALRETLTQVEQLATRDALTGLLNRRHMQQLVEQECLRHARSGTPLTVVLIDLDHFKRVNDTHGHAVGDEVLVSAARVLVEQLRGTDLIGRWGGEEFLLLLPDTPAVCAVSVIDRVRAALRQQAVSTAVPPLRVTFSAGVTQHAGGMAPRVVLERADRALYAAKAAGRDRCCTSAEGDHASQPVEHQV
jgi:diguanylate cyclase (GGDEF)-like protein